MRGSAAHRRRTSWVEGFFGSWRQAPGHIPELKREAGENPARTRHGKRSKAFITMPLPTRVEREGDEGHGRKPGDLPKIVLHKTSGMVWGSQAKRLSPFIVEALRSNEPHRHFHRHAPAQRIRR